MGIGSCSRLGAILLCTLLAGSGCSTGPCVPDLAGLYTQSAQYHDAERNPVIVIPGILGSKLVDDDSGQIVWGAFGGGSINSKSAEGARLCALPMQSGVPLAELKDNVHSAGALDRLRISLLGLPVELNAYLNILGTLGAGGYRDEQLARAGAVDYGPNHFTCFQFEYDWRRSNVENAQRLHEFILEKRAYVRRAIKERFGVDNPNVKFDIVAHSMGGLLTRYFMRYGDQPLPEDGTLPELNWAGSEYVERVIMVGTPNAGSAKGLEQLINGLRIPTLARYEPAVLDTMPAIYELLPRPRHGALVREGDHANINFYDPAEWIAHGWGLASPDQDRVLEQLLPEVGDAAERHRIALDHLSKCLDRAKQFHAALDKPARTPDGVAFYLMAGDAVLTTSVLYVDAQTGKLVGREAAPGDGTVIRTSALMDERVGQQWSYMVRTPISWKDVRFLFTSHLGMTKDPAFTDNVLYLLLEDPRDHPS